MPLRSSYCETNALGPLNAVFARQERARRVPAPALSVLIQTVLQKIPWQEGADAQKQYCGAKTDQPWHVRVYCFLQRTSRVLMLNQDQWCRWLEAVAKFGKF